MKVRANITQQDSSWGQRYASQVIENWKRTALECQGKNKENLMKRMTTLMF